MLSPLKDPKLIQGIARLNNNSDFIMLKEYLQTNRERIQVEAEKPTEVHVANFLAGNLAILRDILIKTAIVRNLT